MFEPGQGIDNRLFHADDQKAYMKILRNALSKGIIDANFLAKQHIDFADDNDSIIIDLKENPIAQAYTERRQTKESILPSLPDLVTNPPF